MGGRLRLGKLLVMIRLSYYQGLNRSELGLGFNPADLTVALIWFDILPISKERGFLAIANSWFINTTY